MGRKKSAEILPTVSAAAKRPSTATPIPSPPATAPARNAATLKELFGARMTKVVTGFVSEIHRIFTVPKNMEKDWNKTLDEKNGVSSVYFLWLCLILFFYNCFLVCPYFFKPSRSARRNPYKVNPSTTQDAIVTTTRCAPTSYK